MALYRTILVSTARRFRSPDLTYRFALAQLHHRCVCPRRHAYEDGSCQYPNRH